MTPPSGPPAAQSAHGADSLDPKVRVVIAEDEAIIRLDLKETLIDEGYEVVGEASRGDEAVALVRALQPDVAILDIKMPEVDGLTAAAEISGERMCAVLILTAFSQRDLVMQARDAGALAYLVKPFERVPAVELAIARHAEMVVLANEVGDLTERLEARKVLDRAKGKLMDTQGLAEADAYRYLQQRAMSERRSMREVAEEILAP
jgi:two-component system, response regulator PdtaR